jgi:putative membrane protein
VTELIIRIVINAIALYVAIQIVPQRSVDFGNDWWKLGAVALIFALVNSYLKPILKALSFPVSMMTLGLVAFDINAAMLLIVAFLSNQLDLGFKVGGFPPNLDADAIIGAIIGAVVISLVSTIATIALAPRKLF